VTDAVGFRYSWDAHSAQFAHASAIYVLTPEGRLSKYFYGVDYSPKDLRLALVEAGAIVLEAKGTRARSARWLVHPMPVEEHSPPLPWLTEKERGSW